MVAEVPDTEMEIRSSNQAAQAVDMVDATQEALEAAGEEEDSIEAAGVAAKHGRTQRPPKNYISDNILHSCNINRLFVSFVVTPYLYIFLSSRFYNNIMMLYFLL